MKEEPLMYEKRTKAKLDGLILFRNATFVRHL